MSALGDYIHLHAKNYKKLGVAKEGQEKPYQPINYQDYLNKRNSSISQVSDAAIRTLSNRLKMNTSQQMVFDEAERISEQQRLIDLIYEQIYTQVRNVSKGAHKLLDTTQGHAVVFDKKNQQFLPLSASSQWASTKSHQELMKIRSQKQQEFKQIQSLITEINSQKQPQNEGKLQQLIEAYEKYTGLNIPPGDSIIGAIQKALQEFRYRGTIQEVAGKFGESLIAVCDDTATQLANKDVYKFLQSAIKGDARSEIYIPTEAIAVSLGNKKIHTIDAQGTYYSLGKTQDKVDVSIKVQNEDLNISVKDYAAPLGHFKDPHLQDVNLLQSLTFLNQELEDFGTHWLNLHSLKVPGVARITTNANQLLEREIAYEALASGSPFKKSAPANVFVYIDRAKGYVYVDSTVKILNEQFTRFKISPAISSISFHEQNKTASSWEERIANIINKAHAIKIRVALDIQPRNIKT